MLKVAYGKSGVEVTIILGDYGTSKIFINDSKVNETQ